MKSAAKFFCEIFKLAAGVKYSDLLLCLVSIYLLKPQVRLFCMVTMKALNPRNGCKKEIQGCSGYVFDEGT